MKQQKINIANEEAMKSEMDSLIGVDELRDCVSWLNSRCEYQNEDKTAIQLLREYQKATS